MKVCPIQSGFVAFETVEEFEQAFKEFAKRKEEDFDDDLCIEGNSNTTLSTVMVWVAYFGIENVYFDKEGLEGSFIDEFYFDLKNARHGKPSVNFSNADEISIGDGFMRVWFD
jgi:hypothetical protein